MDSELSTVNCYDPFKEVYDSQLTNQSFTSMLSDACQNYDVTKDCYVMCPENIFAVSPPKSFQNNNAQFNRDFGEQNTNQGNGFKSDNEESTYHVMQPKQQQQLATEKPQQVLNYHQVNHKTSQKLQMQTDGGKYTNTYNSNQNLYAYTHQNQRQYANQNRENGQQKFHIQLEHNQQQFPVQNNLLNANAAISPNQSDVSASKVKNKKLCKTSQPVLKDDKNVNCILSESGNKKVRKGRVKFTRYQMETLRYYFNQNQFLKYEVKKNISLTTGLTEDVIYNWFQNTRAKFYRESRGLKAKKYYKNREPSQQLKNGSKVTIVDSIHGKSTANSPNQKENKEIQYPDNKSTKQRKKRITLDFDQSNILESFYRDVTWFPAIDQIEHLSQASGMTYGELKTWFQNRRRRDRNVGIEISKNADRRRMDQMNAPMYRQRINT